MTMYCILLRYIILYRLEETDQRHYRSTTRKRVGLNKTRHVGGREPRCDRESGIVVRPVSKCIVDRLNRSALESRGGAILVVRPLFTAYGLSAKP